MTTTLAPTTPQNLRSSPSPTTMLSVMTTLDLPSLPLSLIINLVPGLSPTPLMMSMDLLLSLHHRGCLRIWSSPSHLTPMENTQDKRNNRKLKKGGYKILT